MTTTFDLDDITSQCSSTSFLKPERLCYSGASIPKNIYKYIYKTNFTVDSNNIIRCEVPLCQFRNIFRLMCRNNPKKVADMIFKDHTEIAFAVMNSGYESIYRPIMSSELTDNATPSKIKEIIWNMFVLTLNRSANNMLTTDGSTRRDKITVYNGFATINDVPSFASTIKLEFRYDANDTSKILFSIDSINFYITSEFMNYPNGVSKMFLQSLLDNAIQPSMNVNLLVSKLFDRGCDMTDHMYDTDKNVKLNVVFTNEMPHYDCPANVNNINPEKFNSDKCVKLVDENIDFLVDNCNRFV